MPGRERLFTVRFALMFGFSFTVFLSAFQLLPTAPFHILSLGGTPTEAGLFLAFLTYASAVSAPFMGGVADRLGKRRVLFICSVAIAGFSALYAIIPAYQIILGLVVVHGLFWAGLLSASGAYITEVIPASRRAEGLSFYGFASISAVAAATMARNHQPPKVVATKATPIITRPIAKRIGRSDCRIGSSASLTGRHTSARGGHIRPAPPASRPRRNPAKAYR